MDNGKLVHGCFGDPDPEGAAAAAEVSHHICMAIGYHFLPDLIAGEQLRSEIWAQHSGQLSQGAVGTSGDFSCPTRK